MTATARRRRYQHNPPVPKHTIRRGHLGVNPGNITGPQELYDYEAWLGRRVDSVNLFNGRADWTDWKDGIGYIGTVTFAGVNRDQHWSICMFPTGGTLAAAAAGTYDADWRIGLNNLLAAAWPKRGPIYLRFAWEMNLSGQPWYAVGNEATYVTGFKRFVSIARTVSRRFKIEWCPNLEDQGNDPELMFPGPGWADILSMDQYVYMGSGGFTGNPSGAFGYYFGTGGTPARKVQWIRDFAIKHHLMVGMREWAASASDFGPYVSSAGDFYRINDFAFTAWWELGAGSGYDGTLHTGTKEPMGQTYVAQFGVVPPAPWTPTQITPTRWLNAQTLLVGVSNGTAVASVTDLSANAAHWTQATGTLQPLAATMANGKRSIDFDGTDDVMTGAGPVIGTAATTMALVAKPSTSTSGSRHAIAFGNSTAGQNRVISRIGSPLNAFRLSCIGTGNDLDISAVLWDRDGTEPDLVVWECDPANTGQEFSVYINGDPTPYTFDATGTAINTTTSTAYLGGRNGVAENWRGPICEGILKVGALTTDERQKLEGYMAWNNGIQSKLHASHPHKSGAPTL